MDQEGVRAAALNMIRSVANAPIPGNPNDFVRAFQEYAGVPIDGRYGPQTQKALKALGFGSAPAHAGEMRAWYLTHKQPVDAKLWPSSASPVKIVVAAPGVGTVNVIGTTDVYGPPTPPAPSDALNVHNVDALPYVPLGPPAPTTDPEPVIPGSGFPWVMALIGGALGLVVLANRR